MATTGTGTRGGGAGGGIATGSGSSSAAATSPATIEQLAPPDGHGVLTHEHVYLIGRTDWDRFVLRHFSLYVPRSSDYLTLRQLDLLLTWRDDYAHQHVSWIEYLNVSPFVWIQTPEPRLAPPPCPIQSPRP